LLEQGSGTGSVFKLRLWHNILVGYRPAWNEAVITDPHTFQSGGDLSGQPATDPSLDRPLATAVAEVLPRHDFDAVRWSGDAVRSMLEAVGLSGILLKARDTASHTLAWAIWLLGEHSRWQDPAALPRVVDEVLRLHPPLWLGTRVVSRDVELAVTGDNFLLDPRRLAELEPTDLFTKIEDRTSIGSGQLDGAIHYGLEHDLKIERGAHSAPNFTKSCKVAVARLHLLDELCVLDGNAGLISKGL